MAEGKVARSGKRGWSQFVEGLRSQARVLEFDWRDSGGSVKALAARGTEPRRLGRAVCWPTCTGPEQRCRWPWPWPRRRRVLSDTDMMVVGRREA